MTQDLCIVAVDLGGWTAPVLMPCFDTRCPTTGAGVDPVAVDRGVELVSRRPRVAPKPEAG